MARVFVSHASEDLALAREVHRWLIDASHKVFLDQDLRDGITVGEQWRHRLHERLRWADAVVCVVTSAYLASTWCTAEVAAAQSRGSRLLPLLAEPEVAHPLLTEVQHTALTRDRTTARAELAEALRWVDAAWPDDRSPFPGLRPFEVDQHRVFFGRTEETKELAELLRSPAEHAKAAALLVVGPSGCGKSSLVRAGLLPVMAGEPGWWTLPPIVPGADPVAALARELAAAARRIGLDWTVQQVRNRLADGGLTGPAEELLLADPSGPQRHLLIVVDQFEELLTQTTPADRARFAELLRPAMTGPVRVVATLRPEFLDALLLDPGLAALPTRTYTLRPLSREALRLVIDGPARLAGLDVDEHLVARLVDDTDTGEALPLLAFTLAQLTDGIRRGGRLSTGRYEQIGGVQGALTRQADDALAEAIGTGDRNREDVIAGLLRLVTVDEQGRPTRWRVNRADLPTQVVTELDAFVARRLLTTDTDNGTVVIGVAHEAFLSAWPPLAEAIKANATALQARRAVEHAATKWHDNGRPPARLWGGGQLAAAVADTGARVCAGGASPQGRRGRLYRLPRRPRVLVTDRVAHSPKARDFLHASIRRDRYRRGRTVTVLSVLLILALVAAGVAVVQQRDAQEQQRIATARQLITQADALRDTDPRTALQLGIAAHHLRPGDESSASLVNLLTTTTSYGGTLTGHTGSVGSVAFATDGTMLATGSGDGTVMLWDLTDRTRPRQLGQPLAAHTGSVWAVAFAPDGHTLATGSDDGTVILWDLTDRTQPRSLGQPAHAGSVWAMAFAPDGHTLATGSADGMVILWDLTDRTQPRRVGQALTGHTNWVRTVAFAPDGHTLVTGSDNGMVLLWDLTDRTQPRSLGQPAHTSSVRTVAFAPDGHTLATGSADGIVILWDLTDRTQPRTLGQPLITEATNSLLAVAFAPNGTTLATVSDDGTATLWDLTDRTQPSQLDQPLTGRTGSVWSVAFTPNGHTLATGSDDGTVTLWDLTGQTQHLTGHTHWVQSVAFARDKAMLATGSGDGTVTLWDLTDRAQPRRIGQPLTGHTGGVLSVAFAPDGTMLATGNGDGTVTLWGLTDRAQPHRLGHPLTAHTSYVRSVAFAPDGTTLATGSDDDKVILWDLTDRAQPRRLGHPLIAHTNGVLSVAFAPDGTTLATGNNDSTVTLWDLTDRTQPRWLDQSLTGTGRVWSVAFAPDGHTLATGSADRTVILWDLTDRTRPRRLGQPLTAHTSSVESVAFAPDGATLATGSYRTAILWDLTRFNDLVGHALERACSITGGGLNHEGWARYIPGLPYQDTCPSDG
ncbi:MAG: TIR domain-containing protein [Pseudonocardiaceae bacterium]